MAAEDPVYLSVARVTAGALRRRHPDITGGGSVRVLRSVFMKPEHEDHAPAIHARLTRLIV